MNLRRHWDIAMLCGLLVVLNVHLLGVPVDSRLLVASPSALGAGRIWTVLTHAFVHVSWYHLLLDAGAVLMLYPLIADSPKRRLYGFGLCLAGSLLAALSVPAAAQYGFCGLSGVAHGLLVLWGCRMVADADAGGGSQRRQGAAVLAVVLLKSLIEVSSGQVVFSVLHCGDVGVPNTWSHLGGALGGVVGFFLPAAVRVPIFRTT